MLNRSQSWVQMSVDTFEPMFCPVSGRRWPSSDDYDLVILKFHCLLTSCAFSFLQKYHPRGDNRDQASQGNQKLWWSARCGNFQRLLRGPLLRALTERRSSVILLRSLSQSFAPGTCNNLVTCPSKHWELYEQVFRDCSIHILNRQDQNVTSEYLNCWQRSFTNC